MFVLKLKIANCEEFHFGDSLELMRGKIEPIQCETEPTLDETETNMRKSFENLKF